MSHFKLIGTIFDLNKGWEHSVEPKVSSVMQIYVFRLCRLTRRAKLPLSGY